jgi:ribonuclease T1
MRHALTAIRFVVLAGLLLAGTAAGEPCAAQEIERGATRHSPSVEDQRIHPPPGGTQPDRAEERPPQDFLKAPPPKAKAVLEAIQQRRGEPLPGYVGGRFFRNRERRLPPGRYREYDVNPKVPGRHRGAERLVIEQRTGKAYYTDDHYRTFTPMN